MALGLRIKGYWHEWHVGEPVPKELGRVVQIQADGDELNLIIEAMIAARGEHPRVDWRKGTGFTAKEEKNAKHKS